MQCDVRKSKQNNNKHREESQRESLVTTAYEPKYKIVTLTSMHTEVSGVCEAVAFE